MVSNLVQKIDYVLKMFPKMYTLLPLCVREL